jgi:hypothetical protein
LRYLVRAEEHSLNHSSRSALELQTWRRSHKLVNTLLGLNFKC